MSSPDTGQDADDLSVLPSRVRELLSSPSAPGIPFRARTRHLHHTWARTFSSLPELYVQPESLAEIEYAVSLAGRCGRRITTVGAGHSPSDLTCTSGWVMNLDKFDKILHLDPDTGVVTMEAGIRLFQLCEYLNTNGLAMPNLGSINDQSIAGVISTGTHGSSSAHGLLSEDILSLKIVLADGRTHACSPTEDPDLFRAALLSLGALGIIVEVTFQAVPAFSLRWDQTVHAEAPVFKDWEAGRLWSQADFVRLWWLPYMRRAVVWKADVVSSDDLASRRQAHSDPPVSYYDRALGYYVYHTLLYASRFVPRILPWVEWFVFGMQYGFRNGPVSTIAGVQPSRKALLMNCLFSQFVNEWALPLEKGPEALRRLGAWLQGLKPGDEGYVDHGIPFPSEGMFVHSPVEVRVSDSTQHKSGVDSRPWLDPSVPDGPTLYLNAIMYRPYGLDPPHKDRYYEGFEWLMRDLGGKPHWAKNFRVGPGSAAEVERWYGDDLLSWRRARDAADPDGMFVGPWHRKLVLGTPDVVGGVGSKTKLLPLEEAELSREQAEDGGVLWHGSQGSGEKKPGSV